MSLSMNMYDTFSLSISLVVGSAQCGTTVRQAQLKCGAPVWKPIRGTRLSRAGCTWYYWLFVVTPRLPSLSVPPPTTNNNNNNNDNDNDNNNNSNNSNQL